MKKAKLPETCRFKKIYTGEHIFIQGGYAATKHWLFSMAWLESVKASRALATGPLFRRVQKAALALTIAKLRGQSVRTSDLEAIVRAIPLDEYKPAGPVQFLRGYNHGRIDERNVTHVALGPKGPYLDVEYSAALFFSQETQAFIRGPAHPVVIKSTASGEIVALLMCLNPEKINKGKN